MDKLKLRTLKLKVLAPTALILLIQAILLIVFFNINPIKSSIINSSMNNVNNYSELSSSLIEEEFTKYLGTSLYVNSLPSRNYVQDIKALSKSNQENIIENDFSYLVKTLDNIDASGGYIVLYNDGHGLSQNKNLNNGLYLKKNSDFIVDYKDDFIVKKGDDNLIDSLKLKKDKECVNFFLNEEYHSKVKSATYDISFRASQLNDYGYWSDEVKISHDDKESVLLYSLPLLRKDDNDCYGVVGIEIEISKLIDEYMKNTFISSLDEKKTSVIFKENETNNTIKSFLFGDIEISNEDIYIRIMKIIKLMVKA